MIKAVCFDLDGVYFTSESFKRFKSNLPKKVTDQNEVDEVFHGELMTKFKSNEIDEDLFWEVAKKKLEIQVSNEEIFSILRDSYEVNQDVKNYVEKVKTAGYKTCICSNNFVTRVRELDKRFNFIKDFDAAVFSYEVGVMKPDKRIFDHLLEKLSVSPDELVYSDDNEDKLDGAKELGINVFVYKSFKQFTEELIKIGVNV